MTPLLCNLVCCALLPMAGPPSSDAIRDPNPLVPSLPQLTDEEEAELDRILDRFIKADIGQETNREEYRKARLALRRLGPESFFALIRAINRAAHIDGSCPIVGLAQALAGQLDSTHDVELLDFARENIGLGIQQSAHMDVIRALRTRCILCRGRLYRSGRVINYRRNNYEASRYHPMSVSKLVQIIGASKGTRRKLAMDELEKRSDDQVVATLASIAADVQDEHRKHARALLIRHLLREKMAKLREWFKDPRPEVRRAAAKAGARHLPPLSAELIGLLKDDDAVVRVAAHTGLMKISHGKDFGPVNDKSDADRQRAVARWRSWLATQSVSSASQP